jgi:beta-N-acetylglucosaminidase/uncharacterized protein YgiM (DUF1202 family)
MKKIAKKIIILNIVMLMILSVVLPTSVNAAQKRYAYTNGALKDYYGYDGLIKALKKKHPNWTFTILDTGLDWNDVIKKETVAVHGRNLIYYTNGGSWVCSTCGDRLYDSGRWKCASESAVAYYMDPRNWINENNIFQFENLAFNAESQNVEGVKKILSSVPWANGDKITYVNTKGKTVTMDKSYAQVIMEAAQEAGVSPYHLAARIKQEQGAGATASATANGTYGGYVGYYNFFNIKATGSNIIGNALAHAKESGWSDPEKSIIGGAKFIAAEYINRGQSTLYLQKFDVDNTDGALYYHQYMQNVSAAVSEGSMVKSSYESMGMLDANGTSINFVIPVYNNMPQETSPSPDGLKLVTENVKITGNDVCVREGKSTNFNEITKLKKGKVVLRIESATIKEYGFYWDKVVLADGRQGYIARDFLEKVDDVTNANISAVANTAVNLRNGPGINGTKLVTTLTVGQAVTVIETGKYNGLDGYNWSRVKLANGTQGYLVSDYVTDITQSNYIIAYVSCNADGLVNIRSGAGTSHSVVASLPNGTKVTVLQKNAGDSNGFKWDKIVVGNGLEGYIANTYLKYEETKPTEQKPTENKPTENTNNTNNGKIKVDGTNIIAVPDAKVSDIKKQFPKAVVKCGDSTLKDDNAIGTGNVVTVDNKTYTVVKLGDATGDGIINSGDLLATKKYLLDSNNTKDAKKILAMDVNKDGKVNSGDLLLIKKHLLGTYTIQ